MKCRIVKMIYQNKDSGFSVVACNTGDISVPQAARNAYCKKEIQFTAVGVGLPEPSTLEIEMEGEWVKDKRGMQFQVKEFKTIMPKTTEGIVAYLSSGLIKGIGAKTAERIVDKFGLRTFEVMDEYPDSLLEIKGITRKKLDAIMLSYHGSQVIRELATFLSPYNIMPNKIQKIYEEYGEKSLQTIQDKPFSLCKINGFGFLTVDAIAKANKKPPNDPMRIEGGVDYCLAKALQDGHLYLEKTNLQAMVHNLLNDGYEAEVVKMLDVHNVISGLVKEKRLIYEDDAVYPAKYYGYECSVAKRLVSLFLKKDYMPLKVNELIDEAQRELSITLSPKQKEAVRNAFLNKVSIITGGPGTGKTTVQKVLLYLNTKLKGGTVLLTAPTGRASRRMAESTGDRGAKTIHSALGLTGDESGEEEGDMLDADFIIADEFTMTDMVLAYRLFRHVKDGARVVLVGDVNQLPSVGPGNVFREMIQSRILPVTTLDVVFRQKNTSRIPVNAQKMLDHNTELDYGDDFAFYPAADAASCAQVVCDLYKDLIKTYGVENVQVLSPYRKKSEAGVNALNERLWNLANPKTAGMKEIQANGLTYRKGDKVIHNRNKNGISNGDIGFIRDIVEDEDGQKAAKIDFGCGRIVEYDANDLEMVEHSYATTIHKSQGSEYPVVILPWLPAFYMMLRQNILYTAVTRAKEKVIIVGSKKAVCMAIRNNSSSMRNTRLAECLNREYNERIAEKAS